MFRSILKFWSRSASEQTTSKPRLAKLFVSSTFHDMQGERDILARVVLPPLRAQLSSEFIAINEVDLRWGVTEAMARDGGAVTVCLDEIEDCWPLFVGFCGHRIGWRPPLNELPDRYLGFGKTVPANAGMTEIELRYALSLYRRSPSHRIPIFLRSRRLSIDVCAPDAPEPEIEAMHRWLRNEPAFELTLYDSFDDLALRLQERLSHHIAGSIRQSGSTREPARSAPQIDRSTEVGRLLSTLRSRQPTLLYSARGAGTTWVAKQLQSADDLALYIDGRESDLSTFSQHRLRHSKQPFAQGAYRPSEWLLPSKLQYQLASRGTFSTVILDHFEDFFPTETHADLSLIPTKMMKATFIIVTHSERLRDQAVKMKWNVENLSSVTAQQGAEFSRRYLAAFSKSLTSRQADVLSSSVWSRDLATLTMVLDELRRYGRFESLDERIATLSSCSSGADVIRELIRGLETILPQNWKRAPSHMLLCLGSSLRGMAEHEIQQVLGLIEEPSSSQTPPQIPSHLWTAITIAFRSGLVFRPNSIDMCGTAIRLWIDNESANGGQGSRLVAEAMLKYFSRREPQRQYMELPQLTFMLGGAGALAEMMSDTRQMLEILDVGEIYAEGWLRRLSAEDRHRTVRQWAQAASSGIVEVFDAWRLGLIALRLEEVEAAEYLLAFDAKEGRGAAKTGAKLNLETLILERDIALAMLTRDPNALQRILWSFATVQKDQSNRSEAIQVLGLHALTALANGAVAMDEASEGTLVAKVLAAPPKTDSSLLFEVQAKLLHGQILLQRGRWKKALSAFMTAQESARMLGHARFLCEALERESSVCIELQKFRKARGAAEECRRLSENAGMNELEALSFERLIEIERRRANWKEAYNLATQFFDRCRAGIADPSRAQRALDTLEH